MINKWDLIKRMLLIGFSVYVTVGLNSCVKEKIDGIYVTPLPLDSLQTEMQLDNILNDGFVWLPYTKPYRIPMFKTRSDLRYLPYLYLMYNQIYLPHVITEKYADQLYLLCGFSQGDTTLFNLGARCMDMANYLRYNIAGSKRKFYFDGFSSPDGLVVGNYHNTKAIIGKQLVNIDSLRVSVIAHNDRNALKMLEKYYTSLKTEKELAIYYKVMLSYEGNGDLAEKYYNVLKPYLPKHPELLNGIRKVLLRAAICDGNARAQELCDSLGFSLCDYRLPVPSENEE